MSDISCTIKRLPANAWQQAARDAVVVNPANAPAVEALAQVAPDVVIDPQHLALLTAKYWGAGGVKLTVGFMDNPPTNLRKRILAHMNAWGAWANVTFVETSTSPQVRIARLANDGYWSYLGTDVLQIPANEPTLNLDSFTMNTPDAEFYRVVRHETGHTLGFPHEHMRKEIIERIDRNKAIADFGATQGWSPQEVIAQVLTPLPNSALIATAQPDPTSIMCYWLPAKIMKDNVAVSGGADINARDAQFGGTVYPGPVAPSSIWPGGKAYFFQGSQYDRYDVATDKVDAGYPKPIAGNWPGFPAAFAAGVDTCVLWTNGKAYCFKGNQYLRYDMADDKVDAGYPQPIAGNWPGFGGTFATGVNAAVVWNNGKAYFFKGARYIRYDIKTDKVDAGYPKPIAGNWPGFPTSFARGIDAAVVWNNGKAYFFKGAQYIRYDMKTDKVDGGYPKPIAGGWPGLFTSSIGA